MTSHSRTWLLTGAEGMLARDIRGALTGEQVFALNRTELDITDAAAVRGALAGLGPGDVVVNAAAYTAVDAAESDEAAAFAVNAVGPLLLARECARTGAHLLQVSTDYVFSGEQTQPYPTDFPTVPRTAYGRSKAAGEWAVRAELPDRHWIVRTAWLYGLYGPSFVGTMAKLEASQDFVDVVNDQHGQPTWTRDLAERIHRMVAHGVPAGTYHGCNSGQTTWYGLARSVFTALGADPARVRPTTSAAFVRPAVRPAYSVLDQSGWTAAGLAPLRPWGEALTEAVREGWRKAAAPNGPIDHDPRLP